MNAQAEMNIYQEHENEIAVDKIDKETKNEVALADGLTPIQVFCTVGSLDKLVQKYKDQIKSEVFDVSTPEGRKRIASVAKKIGGDKARLEKIAMGLTEDWRSQTALVNTEKKHMKEELDALRDEIKAPLEEYRNREKVRTDNHETRLAAIQDGDLFEFPDPDTGMIADRIYLINDMYKREWEEFAGRAEEYHKATIVNLERALENRKKADAEKAELLRLRKEKEDRETKERADRIAKEAADKAKADAEEKAQRDKEEAAAKAKAEQERVENEKAAADKRAADAEQARIDAETKAKADTKAAAEKAEADKQAAIDKERADADAKRKAEADATAKRAADTKHREKINQAAAVALSVAVPDLIMHQAVEVVEAIAAGKLPGVKINY